MARQEKDRYHRRADGLMETTRVDKRTNKRVHFYGHTNAEIERQIMDYTGAQERGRLFQEVAKEWNGLHFPTLASNTLKSYKPAYERAVTEFGDIPIRKIKPQDIKRFINDFARGGRAKKTVTTQLQIIGMICSHGVQSGDTDFSAADHVTIPKNLTKGHREAATASDEAKVKETVGLWLFPYLLLYTGLRKGEALALTFADIDRKAGVIRVTKSVYHEGDRPHIKLPKTAAGIREVPILDPLKKWLPKKGAHGDYIFSDDGGKTPLTNRRYLTLWGRYAKETGIECTAHQLRHSYATMLFECGIELKDAQDLLGHSTAAMTQDIYTHIRDSRKKSTAELLNQRVMDLESKAK